MARCEAECPYDDQIAYCSLPKWHISDHEGTVNTRCDACKRRDMHAEGCRLIGDYHDVYDPMERVRWEGPNEPIPELDVWSKVTANMMPIKIRGGKFFYTDKRPERSILDMVLGSYDTLNEDCARIRDYYSKLKRKSIYG